MDQITSIIFMIGENSLNFDLNTIIFTNYLKDKLIDENGNISVNQFFLLKGFKFSIISDFVMFSICCFLTLI
jgi:hypothetical protein